MLDLLTVQGDSFTAQAGVGPRPLTVQVQDRCQPSPRRRAGLVVAAARGRAMVLGEHLEAIHADLGAWT